MTNGTRTRPRTLPLLYLIVRPPVYSPRTVCVVDIHAKVRRHANPGPGLWPARQHRRQFAERQWSGGKQTAPVPAVSQVVQLQPPASPAHTRAHGRETVQVFLLRAPLQTAQPRPTTH